MASRILAVVSGEAPANCQETLEFDGAITAAQIFQGVAFLSLAIVLIFANNAKIGAGAKAPLEVRYQTSLTISVAVCLFSGFFNILQMTALDDFELPRSTTFTLDLSRPVEWLLTCPVLQLILVILGGARIPGYRKFMMPLLCAANLLCGVASMFSEGMMQWTWFVFGFMLWMTYTYYNIVQIRENSDGDEGFFHGDSDYRRLSVLCIFTWFPFPLWFIVSPEGIGLVTDITIIQMGWAVLNVVAKFGFILHLQHNKNKYCKTLEATRELYGLQPGQALEDKKTEKSEKEEGGDAVPQDGDDDQNGEQKMISLIKETMISLGLSAHSNRFLKLMLDNGIVSTDILERLTQDRAMDLNLPWSLCDAVQRRWRAEKLNLGQDKGGVIEKEDPFKKLLAEGKARRQGNMPGQVTQIDNAFFTQAANGTSTPPLASLMHMQQAAVPESRMDSMEAQLSNVASQLEQVSSFMQAVMSKVESFDNSQEAICQRLDFAQQAQLQTLNSSQVLLHKIDSAQEDVVHKMSSQKDLLDKVVTGQQLILDTLAGTNDSAKKDLLDSVANSSKALLQKLDVSQQELLQKQSEAQEVLVRVNKSQNQIAQKMDINNDAAVRRTAEMESAMDTKLQQVKKEVCQTCSGAVTDISQVVSREVGKATVQTANATQTLDRAMAEQEERLADVRRQNMMIMDMLTGTQERVTQSAASIEGMARRDLGYDTQAATAKLEVDIRTAIGSEMTRLQRELETALMGGSSAQDGEPLTASSGGLLASAAERLEAAANRLERKANQRNEADELHGSKEGHWAEVVRREISAVAMALTQQQREIAQQHAGQFRQEVGQSVRNETERLSTQMHEFEGAMEGGIARLEKGLNKALASGEGAGSSRKRNPSMGTSDADRG
eukprot:TRINITY_DN1946_c0_g1_i4.p1 TRINITY_DN1946_c0_g1~~TRINITY_DN1946_c0_g1_i4.p1  ORF type:complete len:892 (+),score=227.85 TRINITY_DN1946_c0_g1_i4:72-2747(+)